MRSWPDQTRGPWCPQMSSGPSRRSFRTSRSFDVQLAPGGLLRVMIDHPKGVDHELCSSVTNILRPYLDRYTLEVSSPGIPRPLVKPAHYVRHIGHAIQVRTVEPVDGRRTFTGVLRDANDERIALAIEDRPDEVVIPLGLVRKSHLVEEQR